ncbi:MAG: hypothetical protein U0326_05360 [Polyangiales bacterium]
MQGHPLDPLLDEWSHRRRRDGVDLRVGVYRALAQPGPWTRTRLLVTLRSLMAFDADERADFDALFNRYFPAEPPWERILTEHPDWSRERALAELRDAAPVDPPPPSDSPTRPSRTPAEPAKTSDPDAPSQPPTIEPPAPWWRRAPWLLWASAGALLIALVSAYGQPPSPPPRPHDAAITRDAAVRPADAGTPDDAGPVVQAHLDQFPSGQKASLLAVNIHDGGDAIAAWRRVLRHIGFTLLGALALWEVMLLADLLARWRAAWPALAPDVVTAALLERDWRERLVDHRAPFALSPPLDDAEITQLAWRMGFAPDSLRPELDVVASVRATADAGGMIEVVYRSGRKAATLCVARPPALDAVSTAVVDCFVEGMRAHGVDVETVTDATADPADLTLVLVDARDPRASHVEAWATRPHVAFVEVRDAGLWGDEVLALPRMPFTLDASGLAAALDAARTERPPPKARDALRGTDRERLGRATRLAIACSLCAPFDLAVADALRREFTPKLGFLAIQRVLALHGVTGDAAGWKVSDGLRAWLFEGGRCDADFEREVLRWQRDRLRSTAVPAGSRAAAMRAQEIAWLTLRIGEVNDARSLAAWLDVMESKDGHTALRNVFDARVKALSASGQLTLPAMGESLEERRLKERLAKLNLGDRDPVTLAWPTRWPKLALESLVAAVAFSAAVVATAVLEEPRTELWSGTRSREVGTTQGHAFEQRCPNSSIVLRTQTEEGRDNALVCGYGSLDFDLPKFIDWSGDPTHVTTDANGVGGRAHLEIVGLRGRLDRDGAGEVRAVRVTGLVTRRGLNPLPGDRQESLAPGEDFLFACGSGAGIGGIYGHLSADRTRVVGLGLLCRQLVSRGVP